MTSYKKAFSLIEISIVLLIIGILVAGVTQSSVLVNKYKISVAQNLTITSPVHSIKDLVLWLEPVMESSISSSTNGLEPSDGDFVSSWNDLNSQLSSKINLTQATSGRQPTYKLKGISNLPSLFFDGTDYLKTLLTTIPAGYNNYTIFAVWQSNTYTGVQVIFHQHGDNDCNADYAGLFLSNGSLHGWGCSFGNDTPAGSYSLNKPYASIYRVDSSQANNVTVYSNGTKYGPTAKTLNIGATSTLVGFDESSVSTYYFNGLISEIIVFTRPLKDSEIIDIRSYLAKKYAFAA